jgi:hypothetical protein
MSRLAAVAIAAGVALAPALGVAEEATLDKLEARVKELEAQLNAAEADIESPETRVDELETDTSAEVS